MNSFIEKLLGLDTLNDQIVAMDLLVSVKSAIQLNAVAATEAATPEVKAVFIKHLHEAIDSHARLTDYLMRKGWYQPFDLAGQIQLDQTNARTALSIPT